MLAEYIKELVCESQANQKERWNQQHEQADTQSQA
jgi:hypothetical protein